MNTFIKTIAVVILISTAALGQSLRMPRSSIGITRSYTTSRGTTVAPYVRTRTAPYTGTLRTGKHPQ